MSAPHTYRINEIFYSLQGEGFHTGMPAVFIRFAGCNLACPFCDTDFSTFSSMTATDIVQRVQELTPSPHSLIILTGGEPSLQVDTELLELLHRTGKKICMETNGTHVLPAGIDWVTCSPKEGSKVVLVNADELKVVYTGQDPEPWQQQIQAQHLFLQPLSCSNTDEVMAYILLHPHWRLSLQTHKLIGIK